MGKKNTILSNSTHRHRLRVVHAIVQEHVTVAVDWTTILSTTIQNQVITKVFNCMIV